MSTPPTDCIHVTVMCLTAWTTALTFALIQLFCSWVQHPCSHYKVAQGALTYCLGPSKYVTHRERPSNNTTEPCLLKQSLAGKRSSELCSTSALSLNMRTFAENDASDVAFLCNAHIWYAPFNGGREAVHSQAVNWCKEFTVSTDYLIFLGFLHPSYKHNFYNHLLSC